MNDKEEKIRRLQKTITRLSNANGRIKELNSSIKDLKKMLEENIKINDEVVFTEYADDVSMKATNSSTNISGKIIPSLYRTIEKLKNS